MSIEGLVGLLEAGDLYGLMLGACRAWLEQHHPAALWACVVAHLGDGIPSVRVTIPGAGVGPAVTVAAGDR